MNVCLDKCPLKQMSFHQKHVLELDNSETSSFLTFQDLKLFQNLPIQKQHTLWQFKANQKKTHWSNSQMGIGQSEGLVIVCCHIGTNKKSKVVR